MKIRPRTDVEQEAIESQTNVIVLTARSPSEKTYAKLKHIGRHSEEIDDIQNLFSVPVTSWCPSHLFSRSVLHTVMTINERAILSNLSVF